RGIQLQGWTIESWLQSPEPIVSLAKGALENLGEAYKNGNIEIGISGYAHPILPLLSPDLIYAQIALDLEVAEKYLGKPTWFWFPEGAVDQKLLKVLFENFPELIVVIPDRSLGKKNFSGFVRINRKNGGEQGALVCDSLLKDIMMNAEYYPQKPSYAPENIDWPTAQKMVYDGEKFGKILQTLGGDEHVLARDWENKGSKDGLFQVNDGTDVKGLVELEADFYLPSETDWSKAETISIEEIKPGSWEVGAPENDPFLYWRPNKKGEKWKSLTKEQKEWVGKWNTLVEEFDQKFQEEIAKRGGVKKALEGQDFKNKLKKALPALLSCVPWHFTAKPEWGPDPGFSKSAWEKIVQPSLQNLLQT
ncbi:MAG: hypothetical protein U9R03_00030, partial [Candidatus Aerophobetes bacterium]|nr:hypothetical protein [Candidatus Aerophobetes bacterium]